MSIDVIGNFLTIIRNGVMRSKPFVHIPYSRLKHQLALVLKDEGFIREVAVLDELGRRTLKVMLKYVNGESVIHEMNRVSTPGSRVYRGANKLGTVAGGLGVVILSTNKGLITNKRARDLAVGGEVLCTVW